MVVSAVQASVEVSFDTVGTVLWEEAGEISIAGVVPLRLYPPNVPIVYTTSGNMIPGDVDVFEVDEVITFTGESSVTLTKPGAVGVSISQIGAFKLADGSSASVTLVYNPIDNSIDSSVSGYGVAHITYASAYRKYLLELTGGPCPAPYETALVVAIDPQTNASSTADITPGDCTIGINFGSDSIPDIVIEIDPDNKPAWINPSEDLEGKVHWVGGGGSTLHEYFGASAKVRISPSDVDVNILIDYGELTRTKADIGIPTSHVDQAHKEVIYFSGSASASLRYTPSRGISYKLSGNVYGPDGDSVIASLALPGDNISTTEWSESGSYSVTGSRRVLNNEVVLTFSGKELPGYGAVSIEYIYTYNLYDLEFGGDSSGIKPSNIVATTDMSRDALGQAGSKKIDPPVIKGKVSIKRGLAVG